MNWSEVKNSKKILKWRLDDKKIPFLLELKLNLPNIFILSFKSIIFMPWGNSIKTRIKPVWPSRVAFSSSSIVLSFEYHEIWVEYLFTDFYNCLRSRQSYGRRKMRDHRWLCGPKCLFKMGKHYLQPLRVHLCCTVKLIVILKGWCQWTKIYGEDGPSQGASAPGGGRAGQCKTSADCASRVPYCSKLASTN